MWLLRGIRSLAAVAIVLCGAIFFAQSQGVVLIAQNGLPSQASVRGADGNSGLYFGTGFMGVTRHMASGCVDTACIPVLSTCGSAPAPILATGSNDLAGTYTTGGTATTCTLTFGTTYNAAPSCAISAQGTATQPTYTVSATAITVSVDIATTVYAYHCIAKSGG